MKKEKVKKININLRYFIWTMVGIVLLVGGVLASNYISSSGTSTLQGVWNFENVTASNVTLKSINNIMYVQSGNFSDIQVKINNCGSNGCKVIIPSGVYNVTASIRLKSNISLEGDGYSSFLYLNDGINAPIITSFDTNINNSEVKGLRFDGNYLKNNGDARGIRFSHASNVKVYDNYFSDINATAIILQNGQNNEVYNNFVKNALTGISIINITYSKFNDNRAENISQELFDLNGEANINSFMNNYGINLGQEGFDLNGNSSYNRIIGNHIENISGSKSAIYLVDGAHYNEVIGNTIRNSPTDGITIDNQGDEPAHHNIISNNYIEGTNRGIAVITNAYSNTVSSNIIRNVSLYGIFLSGAVFNSISNNIVEESQQEGLYIFSSSFNSINGNVARNNGLGGTTGSGIRVGGTSNNNTISGNVASDTQTVKTQLYGIRTRDTSSQNLYTNNLLIGNKNSDFSQESSQSSYFIWFNGTCITSSNGNCI